MAVHFLKCWPFPFEKAWDGKKTHEVRHNDRDFAIGDILRLREYDPNTKQESGRVLDAKVTDITTGFGLPPELCVMSIQIIKQHGE